MQPRRSTRSGAYLIWRFKVEDAYRAAGMASEADRWASCSDPANFFTPQQGEKLPSESLGVVTCAENPEHFTKNICPSCDFRTCPDCAHRHAARLLDRYMPALRQHFENPRRDWSFKHITLTTSVSLTDSSLRDDISALYGLVRKLFENLLETAYKRPVGVSECGLIVAHEFGFEGHKLHFHVLYYGPWIYQSALSSAWQQLTGWSNVWIAAVGQGEQHPDLEDAVAETLKYTTKFWKRTHDGKVLFMPPHLIPVLHRAMQGTRRVRSWGLFYNIQEQQEPATCPDCGSKLALLSKTEYDIWLQTGWMPSEVAVALRDPALINLRLADKSGLDPPPKVAEQGVLL